jgi:hypothetical protein
VGILLVTQPFFIGGIDNVEKAKGSAFGAAATFLLCFVVSVCLMLRDTRRQLEFDSGASVGSRGSGIGSLQGQASTVAADLLARGGSLVPFGGTATLFHDYDPVQTEIDDILDDMDRGALT